MKKWIFFALLAIMVILWQSIVLFNQMTNPIERAQDKVIEAAKKEYHLKKIEDVTFFNGDESYQVIWALNDHDEHVIVWVPENDPQNMMMKKADDGWDKSQVRSFAKNELDMKKLKHIRLGIKHDIPVWEITFIDENNRFSFFYLRFDGETWVENYRLKM